MALIMAEKERTPRLEDVDRKEFNQVFLTALLLTGGVEEEEISMLEAMGVMDGEACGTTSALPFSTQLSESRSAKRGVPAETAIERDVQPYSHSTESHSHWNYTGYCCCRRIAAIALFYACSSGCLLISVRTSFAYQKARSMQMLFPLLSSSRVSAKTEMVR